MAWHEQDEFWIATQPAMFTPKKVGSLDATPYDSAAQRLVAVARA